MTPNEQAPAPEVQAPLKSFHFSVGNSFPGPVGYCARVLAHSPEEALKTLQAALELIEESDGLHFYDDCVDSGKPPVPGLEYLRLYVNSGAVSAADIDDYEERAADGT